MTALADRTSAELIEEYLSDMKRSGRLLSKHTQLAYRRTLELYAEDVGEVGLLKANRLHVKATLRRWDHPNSQRCRHAAIGSFHNWCVEEGYRETNPASQVRKAKAQQATVYRLTREEVRAIMAACQTERETRVIYLGLCTGARRAELIGLRGRHFARPQWVQIAADAGAKGLKTRWVYVLPELAPIAAQIRRTTEPDGPVLYAKQRGGRMDGRRPMSSEPLDHTTVARIVREVAKRAGIAGKVSPHTLRYAFATMVARHAGLRAAQALLGHSSIETTARIYVDAITLDELAEAVEGCSYVGEPSRHRSDLSRGRPNLVLLSA